MKKHQNTIVTKVICTVLLLICTISIIYNMIDFPDHSYFFSEENFNPYTNVNVINGWADLLFITNIGTFLGFAYFATDLIYYVLKKQNLSNNLHLVVITNEVFIFTLYCIFQIATNGTWGIYALNPASFHNFGFNLLIHIVTPIVIFVLFLFSNNNTQSNISVKKIFVGYTIFFVIYVTTTKILGEFAFSFKWFPYPIFSLDAIWFALFGSLDNYNTVLSIFILITAWLLVVGGLLSIFTYVYNIYIAKSNPNKKSTLTKLTFVGMTLSTLITLLSLYSIINKFIALSNV